MTPNIKVPGKIPDASLARLHSEEDLASGQLLVITAGQHHHLRTVLRARVGDGVLLFNGRHGEWLASVESIHPRQTTLVLHHRIQEQTDLPDLWLVFSPLTKERTNYAVEKATELGVARFCPVVMTRTRPRRIAIDRLRAVAIGAAQQCGGLDVPEILPLQPLASLLADWPPERRLFHCDEQLASCPCQPERLAGPGPKAVLVGPEGGLDQGERAMLQDLAFTRTLSLGSRILRAETAIVAALTLMNVLPPEAPSVSSACSGSV